MDKNLSALWIFYRKLIIPAVLFSLLLSFLSLFSIENFGLCFFLILPLLHFFIYDIRLKSEYYFYAHFGFSKLFLWVITLSLGLIIKIITRFL